MSLLRLLDMGSSMAPVKEMGRYNFTKRQAIPIFGASRKREVAELRSDEAKPVAASPSVAVSPVASKVEVKPVQAAEKESVTGLSWLKKANPFSSRKTIVQPAAVKSSGLPVQPELSLDKVKVVRNDLSDADLEIVPKVPVGTTIPGNRYMPGSSSKPDELGKKTLGLLGRRLFGAAAAKH